MPPSPAVLALPPLEQPSTTQTSLPPPKVVGGKEAGQGGPQPEDKGKDKKTKTLPKAKDKEVALPSEGADPKAKGVAAKAKEADTKAKGANLKANEAATKGDPPYAQGFLYFCTSFCYGSQPLFIMHFSFNQCKDFTFYLMNPFIDVVIDLRLIRLLSVVDYYYLYFNKT